MNFPLDNFKDMNEVTFREFIKALKTEILAEVVVDLPVAAADTLGCVKVGSRLTITDGVLSADAQEIPTASADTLGGVKVGSGLTITDGVLSSSPDLSALQTKTLTTPVTIGGNEYTTVEAAIAALAAL